MVNDNSADRIKRSTREIPSQMTSRPEYVRRKSSRLEKLAPLIEKSTPLRRSDRRKKQTSASSIGSQKSNPSRVSERRLIVEAKPFDRKRKTMDARTFKALFTRKRRKDKAEDGGDNDELEGSGKSLEAEHESSGDGGSENMETRENEGNGISQRIGEESGVRYSLGPNGSDCMLRNLANQTLENNVEVDVSVLSDKYSEPYKPPVQDSTEASKDDKLRVPQVADATKTAGGIGLRGADKCFQYKRKRRKIGNQSNDAAANQSKSVPILCDSIDVESSKMPRDYDCRKKDPHSSNNTTSDKGSSVFPVPMCGEKETQVLDDLPVTSPDKNDGGKQQGVCGASIDLTERKPGIEAVDSPNANNHSSKPVSPTTNSCRPKVCVIEPEERTTSSVEQRSFKFLLKRKISRLSEVLKLSEDLKSMALKFLDYVLKNHQVNEEPGTILQAFVISVCWMAGSVLKQKIDRKASLSLARQHLDYMCNEEETDSVYSKLRLLKKNFLQNTQVLLDVRGLESPNHKPTSNKTTSRIKLPQQKHDEHVTTDQKQQVEIHDFHKIWDEKRLRLEKDKKLEMALIRSTWSHIPIKMEKLKILEDRYAKKMDEHKSQKEICLKDLLAKQLSERNNEVYLQTQAKALDKKHDERLQGIQLLSEAKSPASATKVPLDTPDPMVVLHLEDDEAEIVVLEKESMTTVDSSGLSKSDKLLSESREAVPSESVDILGPPADSGLKNTRIGEIILDTPNSTANKSDSVIKNHTSPSAEQPLSLPDDCDQKDQLYHEARPLEQIQQTRFFRVPSRLTHEPRTEQNAVVAAAAARACTVDLDQALAQYSDLNSLTKSTKIFLQNNHQQSSVDHQLTMDMQSVAGPTDPSITESTTRSVGGPTEPAITESTTRSTKILIQNNHQQSSVDHQLTMDIQSVAGPTDPSITESTTQSVGGPTEPAITEFTTLSVAVPAEPVITQSTTCSVVGATKPAVTVSTTRSVLRPNESAITLATIQSAVSPREHAVTESITRSAAGLAEPAVTQSTTRTVEGCTEPAVTQSTIHSGMGHTQPAITQSATQSVMGSTQPAGAQSIADLGLNSSVDDNQCNVNSTSGIAGLPNQASLTYGANVTSSTTQGFNNPLFMEPHTNSRMATLPLYVDPLQNELNNMYRTKCQATKSYEDTKSRIKFECDKEIQEAIARIQRKHEDRLREAEAAYIANNKQMDTNYNRVSLNRLLAHAFRINCMDPGTSGPVERENADAPSSSMQRLHQSQLPPVSMSFFPMSSTNQPSASHRAMPPPGILQQSASLLSNMPTRPPNHRGGGPHLQRFRPASSMSSSNHISRQHVMPSHRVPINPFVNSLSSQQPQPRPSPPPPPRPSLPPPPPSSFVPSRPPTPQPPYSRNHPRRISNLAPVCQLRMDMNQRSNANAASGPNLLPPLNMSSFNLPGTRMPGNSEHQ